MSQPNRSRARAQKPRSRQRFQIESIQQLETKQLLAPYLPTATRIAVFDPFDEQADNVNRGVITVEAGDTSAFSAAPYVSVSQLTPSATFDNNIVRIEAGPGGDFGKVVYAITRGNNDAGPPIETGGRPGVIYRIDPATGNANVFFDLNTVLNQISPGTTAENSAGIETGLVNWYDITFDAEGSFDGLPSMFVASVDRTDPLKNAIYRIGPDGTFMGLYLVFAEGQDTGNLVRRPSAVHVPPAQQQDFLRGMFAGSGTNAPGFTALFFDANQMQGAQVISGPLPQGVTNTRLTFGPEVGLTSANNDYVSRVYSAFTDFGTPGIPGFSDPDPGVSGIQGNNGELLIRNNTGPGNEVIVANAGIQGLVLGPFPEDLVTLATTQADATNPSGIDRISAVGTPFRRFQDIAFDEFGFFSYGTTVEGGGAGALPVIGDPTFAGSMFVADLASGLAVGVDIPAVDGALEGTLVLPVQGGGTGGIVVDPVNPSQLTVDVPGSNVGGRVVRVLPDGTVTPFAEGFNTSGVRGSGSFVESSLSITFSADGTTLYVADNDGIWQFKSTLSLAHSTAGELVGLGDLRTLGVPFQGEGTAVAVVDTGIDAQTPQLRGRVAPGRNIFTGAAGNDDLGAGNGHGTLVAGVISQFVPQATLQPVNVFSPLASGTTNQAFYDAIRFVADTPFVNDPVRPGQVNRVVASNFGFGTTSTFDTEGTAFRQNKQLVIALKNQMQRLLHRGITPIAASGQFGDPNTPEIGNINGEPIPAILNEVISVTGSYPFPFRLGPTSPPTDPAPGPLGRLLPPAALSPDFTTLPAIAANDLTIFQDRLLSAANRTHTTDFAAPAIGVPTYRRTFVGDGNSHLVFDETGTSLSSGMVTGSYSLLASALDYYSKLAANGSTVSAYLTSPVGSSALDFGPGMIRNLEAYANPHGINSILQWTAVPAEDADIPGDEVVDQLQPFSLGTPAFYREFSRVDVGNAVAAIEGSIALPYLFNTGSIELIDSNNNGFITAQEIENFVTKANTIGMPEAGAMARLLGGTARPPGEDPVNGPRNFITSGVFTDEIAPLGLTSQLEQPGEPNVYQRRFNFFDYSADGKLDGVVSVQQFEMLAHTLLPAPDSFVITDRQRGSAGGYLIDGTPVRNWTDLQRLLPTYAFVPQQITQRFRNFTPNRFGINRGVGVNDPGAGPFYALFQTEPGQRPAQSPGRTRPEPVQPPTNPRPAQDDVANPVTPPVATPTTPEPRPPFTASEINIGSFYDRYLNVAQRTIRTPGSLTTAASTTEGENESSASVQRDPRAFDLILGQFGEQTDNPRVRSALSRLRPDQG
ncbi:S8 family serine peptidase [Tautonia marina]|uniref:S8 family serine peptidase n=1 Tax=Tautonia marina TaxID=2653855 RepID=UPI001260AA52|nr:S8 family serine peptidase [Tautonia marina]